LPSSSSTSHGLGAPPRRNLATVFCTFDFVSKAL